MFEDSLVESQGRMRTQSKWFAIGSFFAQAALLLLLILYPLLHPEALPRQSIERLLIAPSPPHAAAQVHVQHATSPAHPALSLQALLEAPSRIPIHISTIADQAPGPPSGLPQILDSGDGTGTPGGLPIGPAAPVVVLAKPPAPKHAMSVSSGVAAGHLLRPIRPVYPPIAQVARIQGTVVIEATISRQGTIENPQVIEGPPMLRQAAIDAVAAARYSPFLLNGEPVEVQTSMHVIFSLGG